MKPSPSKVSELIRRFQNNDCTPDEIRLLTQWVAQLDISKDIPDLTPVQLENLRNQMYRHLMQTTPVAMHRRRTTMRRYLAAAGWLVLIVSSVLLWYTFRNPGATIPQAPLFTTILNDQNGVKRITLPDGTVVCLNRHSRLDFDAHQYNKQQRFVKLSGEGFFEVARDAARPFIVETGNLRTRVLGTAFNIEAYQQESEVRVALVHGKIALEDTNTAQQAILAPNQSLRYSKTEGRWQILTVQAGNLMLWTKGYLTFNEIPLQEAIDRIGERYHIAIAYKALQLKNKRITASFESTTWQAALENILFVHGLHYKMVNNKIVIE